MKEEKEEEDVEEKEQKKGNDLSYLLSKSQVKMMIIDNHLKENKAVETLLRNKKGKELSPNTN